MKKIILVLLVLICSGCGSKLTCTYKEEYEDIKIDNKTIFNFKDNTYKEVDTMIFENKEDAKNYFNDISEYVEEYNLKLDDNKIVSNLEGKIKSTKKEIKKEYEKYDYKCR